MFGEKSGSDELGLLVYCVRMSEECDLKPDDIGQPELK